MHNGKSLYVATRKELVRLATEEEAMAILKRKAKRPTELGELTAAEVEAEAMRQRFMREYNVAEMEREATGPLERSFIDGLVQERGMQHAMFWQNLTASEVSSMSPVDPLASRLGGRSFAPPASMPEPREPAVELADLGQALAGV